MEGMKQHYNEQLHTQTALLNNPQVSEVCECVCREGGRERGERELES
jgi:hypothetical protein